jgi:hypothetical protein
VPGSRVNPHGTIGLIIIVVFGKRTEKEAGYIQRGWREHFIVPLRLSVKQAVEAVTLNI